MSKTVLTILYSHLLIIVYLLPFKVVASDTIHIASDEWCPYICNEVHRLGILIAVLTEFAKHDGFEIKFNIMPLARSFRLLQNSKLDAVLALTDKHIEEFNLKRSQNIYAGLYNDFYAEQTSDLEFGHIENLK
jgi:polar amino acid transport system substrate-binding protein